AVLLDGFGLCDDRCKGGLDVQTSCQRTRDERAHTGSEHDVRFDTVIDQCLSHREADREQCWVSERELVENLRLRAPLGVERLEQRWSGGAGRHPVESLHPVPEHRPLLVQRLPHAEVLRSLAGEHEYGLELRHSYASAATGACTPNASKRLTRSSAV